MQTGISRFSSKRTEKNSTKLTTKEFSSGNFPNFSDKIAFP